MNKRIPEQVIEDINFQSDIVEVISEYVGLQRKGKNYLGLCPFHEEKTPSFTVTPAKQMFYCFGCNVGGNLFSFLMKQENWTFPETIEYLAHKYGIELPEQELSRTQTAKQKQRRRWQQIYEWTADYYNRVLMDLPEGEPGRKYFIQRGISEETIKSFRLGFAPDRWDSLLLALQKQGVGFTELAAAGLALEKEVKSPGSGRIGYYDRFRNRIIFSILNQKHQPIAFGGRVLDDSLPKYLNSPESAYYSKGNHLYGINKAYPGIREKGFALLVEGYLDVLSLQQAGYPNTVASLGTALTTEQAKLLRRYTQRVVLCYDSDAAGTKATLRAGEILAEAGLRVEIPRLTGANDPDEFLRISGQESFHKALQAATTYIEFKYQTLLKELSIRTIPEKAELLARISPDIHRIQSPAEREGYERFLSLELGLSLEAVQAELKNAARNKVKYQPKDKYLPLKQDNYVKDRDNKINNPDHNSEMVPAVPLGIYRAERMLLRLILDNLAFLAVVEEQLGGDFWQIQEYQQIFRYLKESNLNKIGIIENNFDEKVQSKLANLLVEELDLSQPERILEDCIRVIRSSQEEESMLELQTRMTSLEKSGDLMGAMELLREMGERLKRGEM
ncbi:MAG: DNA primase [Desulfitobacteriaceae bacterium]|nr:DNA primase [Desulfitobacteriaceae bacterium]